MTDEPREWDIGDEITLWAQFVNAAGQPANPTRLAVAVLLGDDALMPLSATQSIDEDGTPIVGAFEAIFRPTTSGVFPIGWLGTGAVTASAPQEIAVRPSRILGRMIAVEGGS
jgi:hypothetical protein